MKFTQKWKNFWKIQKHATGGFTLVELIVVIAILAILAGVAVPAYSGYVEKANKQADITLISEVEDALLLAYYANPTAFPGWAIVCLSPSGASLGVEGDTFAETAMEAKFGDSWDSEGVLALSYSDWSSSYEGTSFDDNEETLLTKVDGLTESLGETIYNASGDNFKSFLTANGLTAANAGDAAVLYVAQTTANLTTEQQAKFVDGVESSTNFTTMITDLAGSAFGGLNDTNVVAATAAYYAIAEAYNTKNNLGVSLDTTIIENADEDKKIDAAGEAVLKFFGDIVTAQGDDTALKKYLSDGSAAADAQAYLDVMNTVNGAKSMVISKGLGNFSSLADIFSGYGDGNVYIWLSLTSDGSTEVANTLSGA